MLDINADHMELEMNYAAKGLNPIMGTWSHTFKFAPVPYRNARQHEFRDAIQAELKNLWLYSDDVSIEICIHHDQQTAYETDELADLDNYAKSILDALKGSKGIMIDDSQVSSLNIYWIDTTASPEFKVSAKSRPDEFVLKPQIFCQMPDDLWYPQGRYYWSRMTKGITDPTPLSQYYWGLSALELMCSFKKRFRAEWRRLGSDKLQAYQYSQYVTSVVRGYHKSRILDDGFELISMPEWKKERDAWVENNQLEWARFKKMLDEKKTVDDSLIESIRKLK